MNRENNHWVVSRPAEYKRRHSRHLSTGNFSYTGNLLQAIHIGKEK
jgi:hypothetical protein